MGKTHVYEGHARNATWYAIEDTDIFVCQCGWSGTFDECATELFAEIVDATCQRCDTMLVVRGLPTHEDTRRAAAGGDPRAIGQLGHLDEIAARLQREDASELTFESPLPDVPGEKVRFDWDIADVEDEHWTIISAGGMLIWKELAYWEGYERFNAVKEILRGHFKERFDGLYPTAASKLYLYGDRSVEVTPN